MNKNRGSHLPLFIYISIKANAVGKLQHFYEGLQSCLNLFEGCQFLIYFKHQVLDTFFPSNSLYITG